MQRSVEHHAVVVLVDLVHLEAHVVGEALELWASCVDILGGVLQRGHPCVAVVDDVVVAGQLKLGEAVVDGGLVLDAGRLEGVETSGDVGGGDLRAAAATTRWRGGGCQDHRFGAPSERRGPRSGG